MFIIFYTHLTRAITKTRTFKSSQQEQNIMNIYKQTSKQNVSYIIIICVHFYMWPLCSGLIERAAATRVSIYFIINHLLLIKNQSLVERFYF
jgi:hypothetical protein